MTINSFTLLLSDQLPDLLVSHPLSPDLLLLPGLIFPHYTALLGSSWSMMDYEKQSDPKLAENAMSTEHEDRFSAKMAGQVQGPVTAASFAHLDEKKILRKVCCPHCCPTCPCDELKLLTTAFRWTCV